MTLESTSRARRRINTRHGVEQSKFGFLAGALTLAIVIRILVGQNLLNQYVGYTIGTGFVGGRFHPATYLIALTLFAYLAGFIQFGFRIGGRGARQLTAITFAMLAVVVALINGGLNAAATITDVVIAPLIMAFLLAQLSERQRTTLFGAIIVLVVFNLVPVAIEKYTGDALLPRDKTETFFRPQGYLDHPLVAGVSAFCAMWGILRLGRRPYTDLVLSALLLLQILLLSVRLPLLVGMFLFLLQICKLGRRSSSGKVTAGFLLVIVPPALLFVAVAMGWLDRFLELGLYDEKSAASRLVAFDLLGSLSSREIWRGVSNDEVIVLMNRYDLTAIENSFVSYILIGGWIVALLVHISIFISVYQALRRDIVFAILAIAILFGTIIMSIKTAALMIFLLLSAIAVERWNGQRSLRRKGVRYRRRFSAGTAKKSASHGIG